MRRPAAREPQRVTCRTLRAHRVGNIIVVDVHDRLEPKVDQVVGGRETGRGEHGARVRGRVEVQVHHFV